MHSLGFCFLLTKQVKIVIFQLSNEYTVYVYFKGNSTILHKQQPTKANNLHICMLSSLNFIIHHFCFLFYLKPDSILLIDVTDIRANFQYE